MQRLCHFILVGLVAAVSITPYAFGEDWPTYNHDISRSGVSGETISTPLTLQWTFAPPSGPAPGWGLAESGNLYVVAIPFLQLVRYDDCYHVAVVGNYVYFCASGENKIYCIDAAAGTIKWAAFTDAPARCAPTIANGYVYVGADDGFVYCLSSTDGSQVWKFDARQGNTSDSSTVKVIGQTRMMSLWPVRTGVLVDSGSAYFGSGLYPNNGVALYAVNATTGAQTWKDNTFVSSSGGNGNAVNMVTPQGYLAATATNIVMPAGRTNPTVFTRSTGAFQFQFLGGTCGPDGGSYLSINGNNMYNGTGALASYNMTATWSDQWGTKRYGTVNWCWGNARCVVSNGGTLYMVNSTDVFCIPESQAATAVGTNMGIGASGANTNPTWSLCTWRVTGQNVPSSLILAGNTLFAGGVGKVIAYNAATGAVLWSNTSLNGEVRGLAVANGRLYASTVTGYIYCFGASGSGTTIALPNSTTPYPTDSYSSFYSTTADSIVSGAGLNSASTGFAVILGGETGRLAYELAKRTNMMIYVLEPSAANVAAAKTALHSAGMWGRRITVIQSQLNLSPLPIPPFFANLVVDEESFFGGAMTLTPAEMTRLLHPCGGVAFVGQPTGGAALGTTLDPNTLATWARTLGASITMTQSVAWGRLNRTRITGSADWTHPYADAGNTAGSNDSLVDGPLGMLWFGAPGSNDRFDRHERAPGPLVSNGKFFLLGQTAFSAYDAYNGQLLWTRTITGTYRSDLPDNAGTTALASDDSVYILAGNTCYRLDANTGATLQTYTMPSPGNRMWGWIAVVGNTLYGSRTSGTNFKTSYNSECVFALDITTGAVKWTYTSQGPGHSNTVPANSAIGLPSGATVTCVGITNLAIAAGDGKVYLVDSCPMTTAQINAATSERVSEAGNYGTDTLGNVMSPDPRLVTALDATSGTVLWTTPRDVVDTVVAPSAGQLNLLYKNKTLLVCGSPYQESHQQTPWGNGQFARRPITAYNTDTGAKIWSGGKNYQTRPLIAGNVIYAEPWFYNLATGANLVSKLGGNMQLYRGWGGTCGSLAGSADSLYGGAGIQYANILAETGLQTAATGIKAGCWINFIPADGVLVVTEASAYCNCFLPIQDSTAFYSKGNPKDMYEDPGTPKPVFHVFYNGSAFDGNDETANAADDAAIATDKSPIVPGYNMTATVANYTSYSKGINGVMIDLWNLPGTPVASDFEYRIGNSNPANTSSWTLKTYHPAIAVRKGAGTGGTDRITLTFPDGVIYNTWLQIRVKANAATNGLASDLYYIVGNAIGESGNSAASFRVDQADVTGTRADPHKTFANPAPINDMCDFNRDKKVDTADETISRSHFTTVVTQLNAITVP